MENVNSSADDWREKTCLFAALSSALKQCLVHSRCSINIYRMNEQILLINYSCLTFKGMAQRMLKMVYDGLII